MNHLSLILLSVALLVGCASTQKFPPVTSRESAPKRALASVDFTTSDQLSSKLNEVEIGVQNLKQILKPGKIAASRLHATNVDEVKLTAQGINSKLEALLRQIGDNLRLHRSGQGLSDLPEWEKQRKLVLSFNELIGKLKDVKIVYDQENLLGAFGGSVNLIPAQFPTISITSLDYTKGFIVECQTSWKSGLIVHRNQKTGEITWHNSWKSGIAISGEKEDGSPILVNEWKSGLSSAYDPQSKKWLIFKGDWKTPNAAAFNENTGTIETKVSDWKTGLGGVYNPETRQVEWKSEWKSGVAGYFDPQSKKVIWKVEWKSGVACIWRDDYGAFHTSSGFTSDFGDDEDKPSEKNS